MERKKWKNETSLFRTSPHSLDDKFIWLSRILCIFESARVRRTNTHSRPPVLVPHARRPWGGGRSFICVEWLPLQLKFNWNFLATAKSPWHCFSLFVYVHTFISSDSFTTHQFFRTCEKDLSVFWPLNGLPNATEPMWSHSRCWKEKRTKTMAPDLT